MKEASFAQMNLARLLELQKTWEIQLIAADAHGRTELARSLCIKLEKLAHFIELRRNENLNDLFA